VWCGESEGTFEPGPNWLCAEKKRPKELATRLGGDIAFYIARKRPLGSPLLGGGGGADIVFCRYDAGKHEDGNW
jgi:hypothetical protein